MGIITTKKKKKKVRGATAPKSQDRLKWLLPDGSTGDLVVSKALIPQPLNSVFLTGFRSSHFK